MQLARVIGDVVATQPADKEIHVIIDNLSAHKTPAVGRRQLDLGAVGLAVQDLSRRHKFKRTGDARARWYAGRVTFTQSPQSQ